MSTIKEFLTSDHSRCDEIFASMEAAANSSFEDAKVLCLEFIKATEHHFQMEERIVFAEFEKKTGMTQGPTQMMRHEHTQMRALMQDMFKALESENKDKFFGNSETLMILLQQHNMKEEQMLYPMIQQHLNAESEYLLEMMNAMIVE